jgi:DNA-directed RNA polymerase specialized sigma24 family protein
VRRFEEFSFTEIGEQLGCSHDACRMLLVRAMAARSKMHELLGEARAR